MATRRRALISVYDKRGLLPFARELIQLDFDIIATEGTFTVLNDGGVPRVQPVPAVTQVPELFNGRVKTLHPKVMGGILALREKPAHMAELTRFRIKPIDMVVCNVFPLENLNADDLDLPTLLNHIDIGGPSLIRAAAKNFPHVIVIVNPERYESILRELKQCGDVRIDTRSALALEAFKATANYDHAVYHLLQVFVTDEVSNHSFT